MKKFLIAILAVALVAVIIMTIGKTDYEKAYKKTESLTAFEINMTTTVNMTEGNINRESVIEQVVSVENFNKSNMKYKVSAQSTSTDENGKNVGEVSEYIYYDEDYYLSLPGIKYKSFCGFDRAMTNIDDLVHSVSFPYDKMYNTEKYKEDGKVYYKYDVEYEDVSNHVKTALQSAINNYQGETFSVKETEAGAVVENGLVTEKSLWVVYESNSGIKISLKVVSSLEKTSCSVETPDISKYVSM